MKAVIVVPYAINHLFIIAQAHPIQTLKTAALPTDQIATGLAGYGTRAPAADHQVFVLLTNNPVPHSFQHAKAEIATY